MKDLTVDEILNRAKENLGVEADNELAQRLGVSRALISIHRKRGTISFRPKTFIQLAKAAKITPEEIVAVATKAKIKQILKGAAPILLGVVAIGFWALQTGASTFNITLSGYTLNELLNALLIRLRRWLARFLLVMA